MFDIIPWPEATSRESLWGPGGQRTQKMGIINWFTLYQRHATGYFCFSVE